MKRKQDRNAYYSIINSSFHAVAKLPFVQNKWIIFPVWVELMNLHAPEVNSIEELTNSTFKRAMTNPKRNMVSSNLTHINSHGYYYARTKRKIKGKSQYIDAILVTEPGKLLQLSNTIMWHEQLIIDLPPSWCTRNRQMMKKRITQNHGLPLVH